MTPFSQKNYQLANEIRILPHTTNGSLLSLSPSLSSTSKLASDQKIDVAREQVAVGSVDLDMNDGEVRYKTTAEFGEAKNIKPILGTFLDYHFSCGMRYLKAFIAIRDENVSAERAMEIAGHRGSRGGSSSSDGLLAEIVRTTLQ